MTRGHKSYLTKAAYLLIILFAVTLTYSNTLRAPFLLDDVMNIHNNPVVKDLSFFINPAKINTLSSDSTAQDSVKSTFYTRFFPLLTLALNYRFGKLETQGYHIVNIALHMINSLGVYWLLSLLCKTPLFTKGNNIHIDARAPFIAGLLFAVHPVNTEAVNYITCRFALLVSVFYIYSTAFYIKSRLTGDDNIIKNNLLFCVSIILALIAMFSKENAVTLPAIIILCEYTFFNTCRDKKVYGKIAVFVIVASLLPLVMLMTNRTLSEHAGHSGINRYEYFLTQLGVVTGYLKLFFHPLALNFEYDYALVKSFFQPEAYRNFIALLSLACFGLLSYYLSKKLNRIFAFVFFGVTWFFITMSIESSVFPIQGELAWEYRVYLPSVGIFISIWALAFFAMTKLNNLNKYAGTMFFAFAVGLIPILGMLAYERNMDWKDAVTLYEDAASKSPDKPRVQANLASAYLANKNYDAAMSHALKAINIKPNYLPAYLILGETYKAGKKYDDALYYYNKAIDLNPADPEIHVYRAVLYFDMGKTDMAQKDFEKVVAAIPYEDVAHAYLAVIYAGKKDFRSAIREYDVAIGANPDNEKLLASAGLAYYHFGLPDKGIALINKSLDLKPDYIDAMLNLVAIYRETGKTDEAAMEYEKILRVKPDMNDIRVNLAAYYSAKGSYDASIREYQKVIEIDPGNFTARNNLGKVYAITGKMDMAIKEFETAMKINPESEIAKDNLRNAMAAASGK